MSICGYASRDIPPLHVTIDAGIAPRFMPNLTQSLKKKPDKHLAGTTSLLALGNLLRHCRELLVASATAIPESIIARTMQSIKVEIGSMYCRRVALCQ